MVLVRGADDAMCRDMVNAPRTPAQTKGEVFKITLLAGDDAKTIECRDDTYILDAASEAGGSCHLLANTLKGGVHQG